MKLVALQAGDGDAVLALYAAVRAALPDPTQFQLWGGAEAFIAAHLPGPAARGESLGVWQDGRLIAWATLTRPRAADADNYAAALAWPAARAERVGLLSAAMVAPDRRGRGLQGALIAARIERARALGLGELLARAAPANAVSRQALMHHGFALVWLGQQAGALLRHLYWRPLQPLQPRPADPPLRWIDGADLAAQQRALAEGLVGLRADAGRIGFGGADPRLSAGA